jgi:ribosome-binding factor A
MAGFKNGRITSDIHRELAALIRTLKDPRISELTSIVKVDVSGDLSYAKVYISTIDGTEATINTVKGLKSASGYLRRELSSRIKLRKTPELKFIADDSIVRSAHIASIIDSFEYNEDNDYHE